jgi:hypothetical protein
MRLLLGAAAVATVGRAQMIRPGQCTVSYTGAYVSALNGECSQSTCTPSCQEKIDAVRTDCANETYNETDPITGTNAERSFLQKAVRALQRLGPVDCDYGGRGNGGCDPQCTPGNITGYWGASSFFEQHDCIGISPLSSATSWEAAWHSREDVCHRGLAALARRCAGCTDSALTGFLRDATRKLVVSGLLEGWHADAGVEACTDAPRQSKLFEDLNAACCAGPEDGAATCDIKLGSSPTTCGFMCSAAVTRAALVCPNYFLSDAKLRGLYLDCAAVAGALEQLLAAAYPSLPTEVAHYCPTHRTTIALPGASGPYDTSDGNGRRLLLAEAGQSEKNHSHRALQQGPPSENVSPECSWGYQEAFTASISGECSRSICTAACQGLITRMLTDCHGQTYPETDTLSNLTITRMFSPKAVAALQLIGPTECRYQPGYDTCAQDGCSITEASKELGQECAVFFMGVKFHGWIGCGQPEDSSDPNSPWIDSSQSTKDLCWGRYIKYVESCSGCTDPFIQDFMKLTAQATANTHCEDCNHPQAIADKIRQVCCSGPDGTLGNADDPCTQHDGGHDLTWYVPDTCEENDPCRNYILEMAEHGCPSLFIHRGDDGGSNPAAAVGNSIALGMFVDCGGDLHALLEQGKPCDGLTAPAHASLGNCSADGTLNSGHSCEMTCETGYCVSGHQPVCIDGQFLNTVSCQPSGDAITLESCSFPPNGGCDPLTRCSDSTFLFGTRQIACTACMPDYYGSGRSGCYPIDQCKLLDNGGCDVKHSRCTNFNGGYSCSPCKQGTFGDPYQLGGCKPCARVENSAPDAILSCTGPSASNVSACAEGFYKAQAGQGNVCVECSQCTAGQYMRAACSPDGNAVCIDCTPIEHALATAPVTCTAADDSTFRSGGGGCASGFNKFRLNGADTCQRCTVCTPGKFTKSPCSSVVETVCQNCTAVPGARKDATYSCTNADDSRVDVCTSGDYLDANGQCLDCTVCADGKYEGSPCTDKSDRRCCTQCTAGKYVSRECGGTDSVCSLCTAVAHASSGVTCTTKSDSRISECASSFFRVRGSAAGWISAATPDTCSPCSACAVGRYQSAPCGISTDAVCADCTRIADAATDAKYTCSSASDSQVSACMVKTMGSVTQRYFRTRTPNAADTCSPCSYCSPGTYKAAPCTDVTDTSCLRCSTVENAKGSTTCTTSTDSRVQLCEEEFYRVPGQADRSDVCVACSSCSPGRYQTAPCTSNRDTKCADCAPVAHSVGLVTCDDATTSRVDLCADSFWKQRQGSSQSDLCHSCTVCAAGRYERTACGVGLASQNTDCVACGPGLYQPGAAAASCISCEAGRFSPTEGAAAAAACIDCGAGKYSPLTRLADRSGCIECEAGRWSLASVAASSADCIRCPAGTYVDVPGSGDRQSCIGCEIGKYSEKLGSALASDCVACGTGETTDGAGASSPHICVASSDTKTLGLLGFAVLVVVAGTGVACTKKRAMNPKDLQELLEQTQASSFSGSLSGSVGGHDHVAQAAGVRALPRISGNE